MRSARAYGRRSARMGSPLSAVAFSLRRPRTVRVATAIPVALIWVFFASANFSSWQATHRPIGLGATVLELLVAVLFVCRRSPWFVSRSPIAWGVAAVGTFGMAGGRPAYAPVAGLEFVYSGMQIAGALISAAAVIALGRSFGIVAANRGIRTSGPYRWVRHPLYSGYAITETGYLLENPSVRNWCLFAVVMTCQALRIVVEERTLAADPAYRSYCVRVRGRVVPAWRKRRGTGVVA
jgi:protein-S-isoprenylcysteine O-methyltransferase Ste14